MGAEATKFQHARPQKIYSSEPCELSGEKFIKIDIPSFHGI